MRADAAGDPGSLGRVRGVDGSRIGGLRVERSLAVAMSVFGVVFSLQSVPQLLTQWPAFENPLGVALVVFVYGAVALAGLAALVDQWTRSFFLGAALAYLIALIGWQPATRGALPGSDPAWIFVLQALAVGFIIAARREWVTPAVYSVVTATLVGYLRMTPSGGSATTSRAVFDGVYAFCLDMGLLILLFAIRQAARSVDLAQDNALQRYAAAQTDQATESERVQIDALVHDRVLTTFLSAAGSDGPASKALAAEMAATAIEQLSTAKDDVRSSRTAVRLGELLTRIRADTVAIRDLFSMRAVGNAETPVSGPVAEAVVAATVQAMVNSARHAGGASVQRFVRVAVGKDGSVHALVSDRGVGFDQAAVSSERLGLRVSIVERMHAIGGTATVQSSPGRGTRITLSWPGTVARSEARVAERQPVSA